jgi:hypothetical protein
MIWFIDTFFYNLSELKLITTAYTLLPRARSILILLSQFYYFSTDYWSHLSTLYNFGKVRIEINTSNSFSTSIMCLFVASETCLATRYNATDALLLRAWLHECVYRAAAQQWWYASQYEHAITDLFVTVASLTLLLLLVFNAVFLFNGAGVA